MRRTMLTGFCLAIATFASSTTFGAVPGFTEDFNNGTTAGWNSFADIVQIPADGVGGPTDGFLSVSRSFVAQLGVKVDEFGSGEFIGDLIADGVTGFSFWIKDINTPENLEIHVGIGQAFVNVWISEQGFVPTDRWQQFSVDITSSAGWIQPHGSGTFADALQNCDRLLFRHDGAPIEDLPKLTAGDFGLDRITVLTAQQPTPPVPEATLLTVAITALGVMTIAVVVINRRQNITV